VTLSLVVAADRNRGIGKAGAIPWKLKGDMRFFKELTTCPDSRLVQARYRLDAGLRDKRTFPWDKLALGVGPGAKLPASGPGARNAVLMGRKTWESLPAAFRPLPGRLNEVLSRSVNAGEAGDHRVWPNLDNALAFLRVDASVKNVFVIGGGEIYLQALARPDCARVYLTEIEAAYDCDTFLPALGPEFHETASSPAVEENGVRYRFRMYEKV
jgi:dihydrofolate reductase